MQPAPEKRSRGLVDLLLGPREARIPSCVLIVVALAAFLTERALGPPPERYPVGDHALLELCVRLAAEGSQRLGPEARFHFQHPGPAPFYFAVPFYEWLGRGAASLGAAALVWNLVALLGFVRGASRLARPGGGFLAALLASAFLATRGLGFLLSFWNANLPVLPFAAALVAAARVACGDPRALPVLAFFASLAVQAHAVYLVPVSLVGATALALHALPRLRRALPLPTAGNGRRLRSVLSTAAVLGVLWALPLYDEWTGDYHNLGRMLGTGANPRANAWSAAVPVASRALLGFAGIPWSDTDSSPWGTPLVLALSLLAAFAWAGRRAARRRAGTAALAAVTLAALVAVVVTARAAPGALTFPYVLSWASFVGIAAALVVLAELAELARRASLVARGAPGAATLAVAGLVLVLAQARTLRDSATLPRGPGSQRAEDAARDTCGQLDVLWRGLPLKARPRFLLRVGSGVDRDAVLGLILALDKARLRFAVLPFGPYRLDGRLRPRGGEQGELHVGEVPATGEVVPLSSTPGLAVAWQRAASVASEPASSAAP
jgi:hypothetical protein